MEYKIEPPYPIEVRIGMGNGTSLAAHIIYLEGRGCILQLTAPHLKTGDKVELEFTLPEGRGTFRENSVIVKIYIQMKDNKPQYMAELHFKKPSEENAKIYSQLKPDKK